MDGSMPSFPADREEVLSLSSPLQSKRVAQELWGELSGGSGVK
jgi:hypothetical protein